MAKSLLMAMLVSLAIFIMARPIMSQQIDPNSEEVPQDVAMSPSDFVIYVESPDEAPYQEAYSPAVEYNKELIHNYSKKRRDFLQDCLHKPMSKCGDKIFTDLLDETTSQLPDECCLDLFKLGKDCYVEMARLIFSTYEYKNKASKGILKSKQMWNSCVRRVGNQIGAPVSLEN